MARKYYLKLYYEMLHDPKMQRLSDRLYRRFIECLLFAGENDKDGLLPPIDDMAWTLRADAEQLETELMELARVGVVMHDAGRWIVTKFADRQATMSKAEYMARKRADDQKQEHYDQTYTDVLPTSYQSVTNGNTDINRYKENKEIDACARALAEVAKETWAPGFNEEKFISAAYVLVERGALLEDVTGFATYWEHNGWHDSKPALKNILDHWDDYQAGRNLRKKDKTDAADLVAAIRALVSSGSDWKRARASLDADGLLAQYEALGLRWEDVRRMTEAQINRLRFEVAA